MARETVLITGASSGIGRELARLFAADGSDLVLVARNEGKLRDLARSVETEYGIKARVLARDLADHATPQSIVDQLQQEEIPIDVLVNNAGFGDRGAFTELSLERQLTMLQLNVVALTHLTRLFLPGMIERRRGGILNIGSTAAFQAGPYLAVYYASKAYVQSFTEALAEELKGTGVTATCLAPGPTRTNFQIEAHMDESRLFRKATMEVAPVARAGYEAFRRRRVFVVPGLLNRIGVWGTRFVPRVITRKAASYVNQ